MEAYKTPDFFVNKEDTVHELLAKQEELRKSEQRYRIVAEATKDIIWEVDLANCKRNFYGKLYEILGYYPAELEEMEKWLNIVHPDDLESVKEVIESQLRNKVEVEAFEYRVKCKDGHYKWLLSNTKCEFDNNGEATTVFGAFTDITELKEQQQRINKLAYYDSVTGLPNRAMLSEVVVEKIKRCRENNAKFLMIFIDIDNFKFINDSHGHLIGDKLLCEVGKRLESLQNEDISCFRLGGDEFIILLENFQSNGQIKQFEKHIKKLLSAPMIIDGDLFHETYSSGIVLFPDDGDNFNELLKNADTAMYKSKESGKDMFSFYDISMGKEVNEKAKIQANLHKAIKNHEFVLYYQPIVDISENKIIGCEALIRWIHPEDGLIPPDKFISIAENNGMILDIGKWVIREACLFAKSLLNKGYSNFYVSINISPHQFLETGFTDYVISTINTVGIPPEFLAIEITESVLIKSLELVTRKLQKLKSNNIKILLDDFGSGYSSLNYLRMLPINTVKVDRSFISDIVSAEDSKNITNIIILLAKQLGLKVIAEGVEELHQLDYLKKHSCDLYQGYLKSKPVTSTDFMNLICD